MTEGKARSSVPLLVVGLALMLGLTVYPALLAGSDGRADHLAALAAFWAMSAAFVRGVGFVPLSLLPRVLLGAPAVPVALLLAAWRLC
ncbi:cyd operon YbgE family protein [Crenobacter caeni]|uniref:Cyd operon protein YbgE n=1 Tax=Crenobacter caeni TaxID=2705474 RepID=A0A6B2KRH5_9NEIS|nr:cyd operon YbgE family protein [Crenobacter caeni]NDV12527.1 hypothetical protein [Crenobacter caeni]